jgi:nucleoside-diphosphate-sugar epimerase
VGDVAAAILAAVERETPSGSTYFVAENRSYSWPAFREALLAAGGVKALNIKIPYGAAYLIGVLSEFGSLFTGRPALTSRQKVLEANQRYWLCDVSKAEQELGFKADHVLMTGLKITWQWYRDNKWL